MTMEASLKLLITVSRVVIHILSFPFPFAFLLCHRAYCRSLISPSVVVASRNPVIVEPVNVRVEPRIVAVTTHQVCIEEV